MYDSAIVRIGLDGKYLSGPLFLVFLHVLQSFTYKLNVLKAEHTNNNVESSIKNIQMKSRCYVFKIDAD